MIIKQTIVFFRFFIFLLYLKKIFIFINKQNGEINAKDCNGT
jgi:hypothetical protein